MHLVEQCRIDRHDPRFVQIDHYLHVASRRIIDVLVKRRIGTLVIGKNVGWKQEANMGKKNNQSFVFLPHTRFIEMLTYKAQLVGIAVILTNENHTSKCSFLDGESVGHHDQYAGKRVKRGLFVSATGRTINADVNGAYNMIAKVVPNAFGNGRVGVVVHPVRIVLRNREHVA